MGKYLLFDADGTLYDFASSSRVALDKVMRKNGIAYTDGNHQLYEEGNKWCWEMYEKGKMSQEELKTERFRIFFDKLNLHQDPFVAGDDYVSFLAQEGIMIPGALDFLEAIKDRPKSIITNGIAKTQHGRFDRTNTNKYFDHIFISEEIGYQKPDKAFFDFVLNKIKRSANECLVIGDSEKSDIQGAVNANMDSVFISFDNKKSEKATYNVSSFGELLQLLDKI